MLETRSLNAFYGDFQALFDVDMHVGQGEVVAIIGSNGAGKSTIMRSISGLLKCDPEMVRWNQSPVGHYRADQIAKSGIAMVPEGRQLFPSLTVEENLLIGGRVRRSGPWTLKKVYELFPVLGERRNQASTSLSGGQQQLAAISRALMANPELILLDEISLGLAPIVIQQLYDAFPSIVSEGMSAMVVEQDINKALSVANRVYCLAEGRIALEGHVDNISHEDISRAYFGGA